MGVSTDGVVFYGWVWDDEREMPEEWAEQVARKRGIVNPWDEVSADAKQAELDQWMAAPGNVEKRDAYYASKKAIETEFGVEIGHHGSDSWRVPYVYVVESQVVAYRGYPKQLEQLAVKGAWDDMLSRFIIELGIETDEAKGPAWWLVSWWG